MKRNLFVGLFFVWALFTTPAYASVIINEIAWMGTDVSSTNEWIELFNSDAQAVDLTGWTIETDDGSPSITLSGTISANGYFLIERTDDTTVPSVPADLVTAFGNGLSNGGETLRLQNKSAIVVDTVIGGTDWINIGGDKVTKATAQRTTNSWVTGVATPRGQNVAQSGEVLGASTDTGATASSGTSGTVVTQSNTTTATASPTAKPVTPTEIFPRKDIVVFAGDDKRAFAFFPVTFSGVATGLYVESLDTATYRWNFGDGAVGSGKTVSHVYEFGGEYVATLEVFWSTYHRTDRLSVVVTLPDVAIVKVVTGDKGYIELSNRTPREIDISGWMIAESDGRVAFTFPSNSIILSKKSFLLSNRVSHVNNMETNFSLLYPEGGIAFQMDTKSLQVALRSTGTTADPSALVSSVNKNTYSGISASSENNGGKLATQPRATNTKETVLWEKDVDQLSAGIFSREYEIGGGEKWIFVLLGIILAIIAGFMITKSHRGEATVADEYAIIEDIIEGRDDLR